MDWLQGEDVVGEQVAVADRCCSWRSLPPPLDPVDEHETTEGNEEDEGGAGESEEHQRASTGLGAVSEVRIWEGADEARRGVAVIEGW